MLELLRWLTPDEALGIEESGATIIMGACEVTQAVTLHVHQLSVWGDRRLDWVDDEGEGHEAARQRLIAWDLLAPGDVAEYPWTAILQRFAAWAAAAGPLPAPWLQRTFTPRLPPAPPVAPAAAPLPPLLAELQQWLESESLTQRHKLDELRASWTARLRSLSADDLALARRLVLKHVNSKKLLAARDELLASWA